MNNEQIDFICHTYKTWQAHREHKYMVDVKRAGISTNYESYIKMGGLLSNSLDFQLLRAFLKNNKNLM